MNIDIERRSEPRLTANDFDNVINRVYEETPELIGDEVISAVVEAFELGIMGVHRAIMEVRVQEMSYLLDQIKP